MKVYMLGVVMLISYVHSANLRIDPLVLTPQGIVRGQRATDGDYTTFLGIPYAVVDEDNPFGPAEPHKQYEEEVYRAYDGSIRCPQTPDSDRAEEDGAETLDCLRLNVYVPNDATSQNPLPVLAWIHGGSFSFGYGGEYGVRDIVKQGVVVVTINYRLGPYGFMCLDVPSVTGNQGLKDQYEALKWIRSNIGSFGGNRYNVTLAGQDAGAASALLHLYSSKDKLYHKVIAQSGSPESDEMFVNGDTQAAIKIANHLGLATTDTLQALEYLAGVPHNLVTGAARALNLKLRPCKERSFSGIENFVDSDPYSLSNERKVRNTPVLIGHTSKEQINSIKDISGYFNSDPFYTKISDNFNLDSDKISDLSSTIKHYYIGDKAITNQVTSKLEDFESDFSYNHPMQRTVSNLLRENASPVYEYLFSYTGDSGEEGAGHSAEIKYLFNKSGASKRSEDDQLITDQITTLWGNFIKFGNPTPQNRNTLPVTWQPATSVTRPYLVVDRALHMESRVYNERMAFWDLFYDQYGNNSKLGRQCNI